MNQALVLFPHQLFAQVPLQRQPIYLCEDQLFFKDPFYPAQFHVQRLLFHRASMRAYAHRLQQQGHEVIYLSYQPDLSMHPLFERLAQDKIQEILILDPSDFILEKRLTKHAKNARIKISWLPSPGFISQRKELNAYFDKKKGYSQHSFYIHQRKTHKVLLDEQGKALGGKWSFDADNRKKLPKHIHPPDLPALSQSDTQWIESIRESIHQDFPEAWGSAQDFFYPVTHESAQAWLERFLEERLTLFGDYEDAISTRHDSLFHSLLSPLINSGLLTPQEVLDQTLNYAHKHDIPLNCLEGFVRQILSWREYIRALYLREGVKQRNANYWQHLHPMPKAFYTANTDLAPVDYVIRKAQRLAYAHHIERLMILGNIMCLCEIHPDSVYTWFMEAFIDAYDWVMVPNVYGMSQYADGGLMTTKPYISSSNYIRKMSDFGKGPWCAIWDGLYWRFIHKHRDFFAQNPRLNVMARQLERMAPEKRNAHLEISENYLKQLHA